MPELCGYRDHQSLENGKTAGLGGEQGEEESGWKSWQGPHAVRTGHIKDGKLAGEGDMGTSAIMSTGKIF